MKFEIVYGEGPSSGVMAVAIGRVTAKSMSEAYRMTFQTINDRYWRFLSVEKYVDGRSRFQYPVTND